MLGRIIAINDNIVSVQLSVNIYDYDSLISKNVIFKDTTAISIGEVIAIGNGIMQVSLVGEIRNNKFLFGDISKPSFKATCNLIDNSVLDIILNNDGPNSIKLGKSFIYPDYDIKLDVGNFFSNHFAILGNSGSGKSYSVAKILQSVFYQCKSLPFYSNIFLFDAYGEYQRAFSRIHELKDKINYNSYTENDDFIVEIKNVVTIGKQLTINCKGKDIEADPIRIMNDDIEEIVSDLPIETVKKDKIDEILFGNLTIKKKRIAIRKLSRIGIDKKFIQLFLKLLEYVEQI